MLDLLHAGGIGRLMKRRHECRRDAIGALFATEMELLTDLARVFEDEGWIAWLDDISADSPPTLMSGMLRRTNPYVLTDGDVVFIDFDNGAESEADLVTVRIGVNRASPGGVAGFDVLEVDAQGFAFGYYRNARDHLLGKSDDVIDVMTSSRPEFFAGVDHEQLTQPAIKLELGRQPRVVSWLTASYLHEVTAS